MASGLTGAGLQIKRLAELIEEMKASARAKLGDAVQLDGRASVVGQLIELTAVQIAEIWELVQQVYDSFDPDSAELAQLDNLCAIVGITREAATASTVVLRIFGAPATVIPQGSIFRIPNGARFVTTAPGTIFSGSVSVAAESQDTGPVAALAGTITEAVTIVAGVTSLTNPADATPGQDLESDQRLRVRRELSLSIIGAGPDQAIAARLLALDTVSQAVVISNRTLVADANGTPGKAFLSVVWPTQATDQAVWTAIWESMPAGILSHGAISGTATDSQGNVQPVAYSLATEVDIFVNVDVEAGPNFPGATAAQDAVAEYVNSLGIGDDVLQYKIMCAVADLGDAIDVDVQLKIGSAPTAVNTANLAISAVQIARNDTGDTTVVIT